MIGILPRPKPDLKRRTRFLWSGIAAFFDALVYAFSSELREYLATKPCTIRELEEFTYSKILDAGNDRLDRARRLEEKYDPNAEYFIAIRDDITTLLEYKAKTAHEM